MSTIQYHTFKFLYFRPSHSKTPVYHVCSILHNRSRYMGYCYGGLRHYQQCFSYMVAVSFIGGRNRSIQRKPQICRNLLTRKHV